MTDLREALERVMGLAAPCLPMHANGDGRELWHNGGAGGRVMAADFAGYDDYVAALDSLLRTHGPALLAAVRDGERLDALEIAANEPGGILLHDGSESGRRGIGLRPGCANRTLREAIDSYAPAGEG